MKRHQHILLWLATVSLVTGIAFAVPPDWLVVPVDSTGTSLVTGGALRVTGTGGSGSTQVEGRAAEGAALVGNPVPAAFVQSGGEVRAFRGRDGSSATIGVAVQWPVVIAPQYAYDPVAASWEKLESNNNRTILVSASRTTTQTVAFTNYNGRALDVILDVTDVAAGPSVTLSIDAQDAVSAKWYNLLTGAAVTTAVTNVYRVGPSLTPAANVVANLYVPRLLRVVVTANNANAGVYSVGVNLMAN